MEKAQREFDNAELAYTAAVVAAAGTGAWGLVTAARQALEQTRSALAAARSLLASAATD